MAWFRKDKKPLKAQDKREVPTDVFDKCKGCGDILYRERLAQNLNVWYNYSSGNYRFVDSSTGTYSFDPLSVGSYTPSLRLNFWHLLLENAPVTIFATQTTTSDFDVTAVAGKLIGVIGVNGSHAAYHELTLLEDVHHSHQRCAAKDVETRIGQEVQVVPCVGDSTRNCSDIECADRLPVSVGLHDPS